MSLPENSFALIRRLAKSYLRPHRGRLVISIICMIVVSASAAAITYLVKPIMDEIFVARNQQLLYVIPAILIGLYAVKGVAAYLQGFLMEYTGQKIVADFQMDLYQHIIYQDHAFFMQHTTADLSSRFLFDLHRLKQAVSQTITGSLRDVTMIIGLITVMFIQDWQLALISLTAFPLIVFPIARFGKHMRRYASGTQEEMGGLAGVLRESLGHNRQVKTYTMEGYEVQRAQNSVDRVFALMIKAARVRALSSPVMELLGGISVAVIVIYGGTRVIDGHITTGAFFSFLTALMSLYRPIKGLTNINNVLQEGLAAAERTFEVLDTPCDVIDQEDAAELEITKGDVHFDNISFQYANKETSQEWAIENLSLDVPAGKVVALVGPSGAGKTTVLNLLPRFFDPQQGRVLVDGQDIKNVTQASLRKNIALVTQDVAIFDDTVHNNIAYGRPGATHDEVIMAAKDAAAHDFIMELPEGYDTRLGEEGSTLSGGQKQRIAIARALLKNAPILLLDEATSNLDTESERHVQEALQKLMKGRTTLVVAHRLSTVIHADCIYVMEKGKIVESGEHEELLALNKSYSHLYQIQAGA